MGAAAMTQIWPALIAAIAAWLFGAVYYGLLGKTWVAAQGQTMEGLKAQNAGKSALSNALPFILSFIALFVMAMAIAGILFHTGYFSLRGGMMTGAMLWFGFVLTTIAVNNAFSSRRPMLTIIDAGHWLGAMLIIGAIIGWLNS